MSDDDTITPAVVALSQAPGSSFLDRVLRGSLEAAVSSRVGYSQALLDARLGRSAELDLRLKGAGTSDHRTRASFLGDFLTRAADAVKELAKDIGGLARHTSGLLVEAPVPGSVRVVLRTVQPSEEAAELPGVVGASLDEMALHQLVSLLLLAAEDDVVDGPLEASVTQLRGNARLAVRQLAQSVVTADWLIEGTLAIRGHRPQPVQLTQAGARRLVAAAKLEGSELASVRLTGEVDGWVWSASTLRFVPDTGRPFVASVPPELQTVVAAINGSEARRAVAQFLLTQTFPTGDKTSLRSSFALTSVEAAEAGTPELDAGGSA